LQRAIEYLFPSGLHDPAARPKMKPPSEVFPQRKAAEFDETGRPHHALFYTGKANFFKLLYDIVENINNVSAFEDRMIRKRGKPDETQKMYLKPNLNIFG
jgi:small subunit ribosomal protein S9